MKKLLLICCAVFAVCTLMVAPAMARNSWSGNVQGFNQGYSFGNLQAGGAFTSAGQLNGALQLQGGGQGAINGCHGCGGGNAQIMFNGQAGIAVQRQSGAFPGVQEQFNQGQQSGWQFQR